MRRSLFKKLAVGVALIVFAMCCLLYFMLATTTGSRLLVEKIAHEANISLRYHEGNLYEGVSVADVRINQGQPVEVHINQGYVKIGWAALLRRQVHLSTMMVDTITITNHNPPTDEPFDYPVVELPVNIWLQNISVNQVIYHQATKDPIAVSGLGADSANWYGTKIELEQVDFALDDTLKIANLNGYIELQGDYPLAATANVLVSDLQKHHLSPLQISAKGSLKHSYGQVQGQYNGADVAGEFRVQGVDDGSPFWADLRYERLPIPYAKDENIVLHNGRLIADGVVSAIELRLNTDLSANTIPNGHYFGRALLTPSEGMRVERLTAITVDGTLQATGQLDWRDEFAMQSLITSSDYHLAQALPDEYKSYAPYVPQELNGSLAIDYDSKQNRYRLQLIQKNGEQLAGDIRQLDDGRWDINAEWHNLVRQLPMGFLDSPSGSVQMQTSQQGTSIDAKASLSRFASLPKGEYSVQALMADQLVKVHNAHYQGVAGVLLAQGTVVLAKDGQPLSYDIKAKTPELLPTALGVSGVDKLAGELVLAGYMQENGDTTTHKVDVKAGDLTAYLPSKATVQLVGAGQLTAVMTGKQLKQVHANITGDLLTRGLRAGLERNALSVQLTGDGDNIQIDKLTLDGGAGHLSAAGVLSLGQGVRWQGHIRADQVQTGMFFEQAVASVSGNLTTSGHYQHGNIHEATIDFAGEVAAYGQTGQLILQGVSHGDKHTINRLRYQGSAGHLSATGFVDTKQGVSADIDAVLERFDVGQFIDNYPSDLSGRLSGFVQWQNTRQLLDIRTLDLAGQVNGHKVLASGALAGEFVLPQDTKGFFASLNQRRFSIDGLGTKGLGTLGEQMGRLEGSLLNHKAAYEQLIKRLTVQNLALQFGDNHLVMAGNEKNLQATIEANSLSQIMPTLRGQLVGVLLMTDHQNRLPSLYADLSINNLSMPNFAIRQGSVLAKVVDFGASDSSVVAQAVGVVAFGRNFKQMRVDAKGGKQYHAIGLFVNDGNLQAKARLQGGLVGGYYTGVLSGGQLQTPQGQFHQLEPSELGFHLTTKRLAVAPHCWQTTTNQELGTLCLAEQLVVSPQAGRVNILAEGVDSRVFTPLLPKDLHLSAKLNGKVRASWQPNHAPLVDVALYADNGVVGMQHDGEDTTLHFERLSLLAKSVTEGLRVRGDLKAGHAGSGYVDVVIDPHATPKPMKGGLALTGLNLAVLRPFFPALTSLAGEINVAGSVGGTLTKPLLDGHAILTNGRIAAAHVPIGFENITLRADIKGTQASLEGSFASGDGVGTVAGEVEWVGDVQAKLTLQGERLAVVSPPMLTAAISPHLQMVLRPKQKYVDIKGVVSIPDALIRPPQANQQVVGLSDDVVVLDRRTSSDALALLADVAPWSINADIGVDLGESVVFRGFGATLPLAGAVHLTQQGQGVLKAHGVIQVSERTKVDAIGQNLDLNYAQIRFNGDLKNPRLSIEAVRELSGQTVGVRVTDRVSKPTITVFNNAGLSDQQAMNALVTGRLDEGSTQISEQGFRSQVTNNLAAAGLSLGLRGTRDLTNDLGQALGLQSLVVDASGNSDDTQVNVTGYISPDLYIRYGVGVFNAESSLSMRYQLTRRIYVQATSAAERIVDVVYRWQF